MAHTDYFLFLRIVFVVSAFFALAVNFPRSNARIWPGLPLTIYTLQGSKFVNTPFGDNPNTVIGSRDVSEIVLTSSNVVPLISAEKTVPSKTRSSAGLQQGAGMTNSVDTAAFFPRALANGFFAISVVSYD